VNNSLLASPLVSSHEQLSRAVVVELLLLLLLQQQLNLQATCIACCTTTQFFLALTMPNALSFSKEQLLSCLYPWKGSCISGSCRSGSWFEGVL